MAKKKSRGRPKLRPEKAKTYAMQVRMEQAERAGFESAADLAGLPLSAWVRERLRLAARDELTQAGREIPFMASKKP